MSWLSPPHISTKDEALQNTSASCVYCVGQYAGIMCKNSHQYILESKKKWSDYLAVKEVKAKWF